MDIISAFRVTGIEGCKVICIMDEDDREESVWCHFTIALQNLIVIERINNDSFCIETKYLKCEGAIINTKHRNM